MQRPWPILAGLGICVTLLVVSVLLASGDVPQAEAWTTPSPEGGPAAPIPPNEAQRE